MTTTTISSTEVEVNDEGFFVDPEQWTRRWRPSSPGATGSTC